MDYHMQFLKYLSLLQIHGLSYTILKFFSFLQNHGLSYAISEISLPSPKTWTIICNLRNFFSFSKNMDYHMQFLKFLSLLQIQGLSYAIYEISFPSSKMWNIIYIF